VSDPAGAGGPARLCPSARAEPGAALIGVLGPDGRIGLLKDAVEIDQAFLDQVAPYGSAEGRFRFSGGCVEHGCVQWSRGRCGVIDEVAAALPVPDGAARLQPCAIRSACRWFDQVGPDACRLCPMVITDLREAAAT
jgi:hypothetical protein